MLLAGWGLLDRRRRRELLVRLRSEWGQPTERDRDLEAIAQYHWALATGEQPLLDERTARDLDLDAVFALLDRGQSPVGQRVLYHRLRTSPTPEDRAAFESLMTRLEEDATERERLHPLAGLPLVSRVLSSCAVMGTW